MKIILFKLIYIFSVINCCSRSDKSTSFASSNGELQEKTAIYNDGTESPDDVEGKILVMNKIVGFASIRANLYCEYIYVKNLISNIYAGAQIFITYF